MTHLLAPLAAAGLVGVLWLTLRWVGRSIRRWRFWRKYRDGRFLEVL